SSGLPNLSVFPFFSPIPKGCPSSSSLVLLSSVLHASCLLRTPKQVQCPLLLQFLLRHAGNIHHSKLPDLCLPSEWRHDLR
ncbi:hypothetical protein DFH09DRAFT_1384388, partial [Mycena vulgaris]